MIIISDIHSRLFWKDAIPFFESHPEEHLIFMGDYVDPYFYEGITRDEVVPRFKEILEFKKQHKDRVTLLLANHDDYIVPLRDQFNNYYRWDRTNHKELEQLYKENSSLFERCHIAYDTLFTHAGVTKGWLEQYANWDNPIYPPQDYTIESIKKWIDDLPYEAFFDIGRSRGGYAPYGSCTWADLHEHRNNKLPIKQIFAHTQLEATGTFVHQNNWWMVDSRCCFYYDGKDIIKLEDYDNSKREEVHNI